MLSVHKNGITRECEDILNEVLLTVDRCAQPAGLRRSLWIPGPLPQNLLPYTPGEKSPPQLETSFKIKVCI